MSHQRRIDNYDYRNLSSGPDQLPPARPNSASSDQSGDMIQMHRQPAPPPGPPSARRRQSVGRRASGVRPPSRSMSNYGGLETDPTAFDSEIDSNSRPPSSLSSRPSSSLSKYNPLPPIGSSKEFVINSSDWSVSNASEPDHVTKSFGRLQMDVRLPSTDDENTDSTLDSSSRIYHQDVRKLKTEKNMALENISSQKSHVSSSETGREHTHTIKMRQVSDHAIFSKTDNTKLSTDDHSSPVSSPKISRKIDNIELPKTDQSNQAKSDITVPAVVSFSKQTELIGPSRGAGEKLTQHNLPPEPSEGENRFLLAFKLPDGTRFQRYFRVSDSLGLVLKFVENSSGLNLENFNLVCNSPKTVYSDLEQTLASCGLQDRTLLYLDEKD